MIDSTTRAARILVVGARGVPDVEGGAEKNAEALFPRMAARGYDVTLIGLRSFIKGDEYKGVKLIAAPESRLLRTDKLAYYVDAVFTALKTKPDVVHLQGLGSAIFLWAYKLMGAKVVVRYGSADYILPKWGLLGRTGFLLAEWQLRFADAVISVAPSLSRRLASKGIARNVHLIPNAIDEKIAVEAPARTNGRRYILMVGRVTEQKNVGVLLQAFARCARTHPDLELRIAGGVDDEAYYKAIKGWITDRTVFLGRVPRSEVPGLLEGAAAFVNVSVHEGSSNATLEAISRDKAIVLSDIPENRDMSLPAHIYVDPHDPEAIALKIGDALAHPERYVIDKASQLTWQAVADRTAGIYEQISRA